MTGIDFLADNNFGDTRSGSLAGPVGLVIILLLTVATIFLIRSMNVHLRRVPKSFDQQADTNATTDPTIPS
jgi:hypothetical protein